MFSYAGCNEQNSVVSTPEPERIHAVGTVSFGSEPDKTFSTGQCSRIIHEKFLTDDDMLEIFISPLSNTVWRIDIIIPAVPGKGNVTDEAWKLLTACFALNHDTADTLELSGSTIKITPAYEYGPRGIRISFTDKEYEKRHLNEKNSSAAKKLATELHIHNDLLIIEAAIASFHKETGSYPAALSDLLADPGISNWRGPYIESIPAAPPEMEYIYQKTGENTFKLFCSGISG